MQNGDTVILAPGTSTMKNTGSSTQKYRAAELLKAMTERVTILKLHNGTGNSLVKDKYGVKFHCNTNDLSESHPDYFAGN